MKNLTFYDTETIDELAWPEEDRGLTTESSALEVFTDFRDYKPLVIESSTSALEARELMRKAHVQLKLVVDANDQFLGVVSFADLDTQAVIEKTSEGYRKEELSVTDFMRRRTELKAFSYCELEAARISDVINALQGSGQQHCLVIDREAHKIRGIFSASDIARKLKLPLDIEDKSSFVHIYEAINS